MPIAALVLASLAFTVGGVAIVGRADSEGQTTSSAAPAAPASAKPAAAQCTPPLRQAVLLSPKPRLSTASKVTTLNTRGYNYAAPGEIQMDPSGKPEPEQPSAPKP